MALKSGERQVAYYRSKDPITNMLIRVTIKKLTATSMFPTEDTKLIDDKMTTKEKFQELKKGKQSESETIELRFGEKLFSYREVLQYGPSEDESNSESTETLISKYRQRIAKEFGGDPEKRPNYRLFTYIEGDGFVQNYETRSMTSDANEEPSYLAKNMADLRLSSAGDREDKAKTSHFNTKGVVVERPSEEQKRKGHYLQKSGTSYHIMADLTPLGLEHTADDEYLLCTIHVSTSGVISLLPDFNRHKPPYTVVSDRERREVYEYTLEHVSSNMTSKDRMREQRVMNEIYSRHQEYRVKAVGSEFELPQPGILRVNTFGEIVSAKNFEYDGLYIQYYLDIPMYWWSDPDTCQITGTTQRCLSKIDENGKDEICHFSFPFEFELFFRNEQSDSEFESCWPTLFVEVLSVDTWQRYRTEGYAWLKLPQAPGVSEVEVQCWRPIGSAVTSELRRFFVGGSPELEDITYAAIPTTHEGIVLSKFGFKTESTGSVTLRFNTVMQSQLFLGESFKSGKGPIRRKGAVPVQDRMGGHSMQATVTSSLEAFAKARNRLRAAREGILK